MPDQPPGGFRWLPQSLYSGAKLPHRPYVTTEVSPATENSSPRPAGSLVSQPASRPLFASNDWHVKIRVNKYSLGDSFAVLVFVGPVPTDSRDWIYSPSYAGSCAILSDIIPTPEFPYRPKPVMVAQGVFLNDAIQRAVPDLRSWDASVTVPYLRNHLSWRVIRGDLSPVNLADLPSLDVVIGARPLSSEPGADFPSYGKPQSFPDIILSNSDDTATPST
ncbi:hypothetical protein B0H19DRAFT_992647 [Mycena capillaripes]|nr:hypothetical protein B0H19DRAFT_992647 [Mycena capillaripes]